MLPESTTTTGDSLLVKNMSPFQIIKAEKTIIARLRPWCSRSRLFFHSFLSSAIWSSTISSIVAIYMRRCAVRLCVALRVALYALGAPVVAVRAARSCAAEVLAECSRRSEGLRCAATASERLQQ